MKKLLLAGVLALGVSLSVFSFASASVSSLTVSPKADLLPGKTSVVVNGTIVCTQGDTVDVTAIVIQGNSAATGTTSVTCTGAVQNWAAGADTVIGSSLKNGPASYLSQAFDNTDGTSFPTIVGGLHLK